MITHLKKALFLLVLAVVAAFNLIAVIIPFIELIAGSALITGIYSRSAALVTIAMLLAFIIVISINVIRGHEFDCGCFSLEAKQTAHSAWYMLGRDIILLMLGSYIFMYGSDKSRLYIFMRDKYYKYGYPG